MPNRRIHSFTKELLLKSREAAMTAVQVFNNPLVRFKSETFIVLMNIAWTYMMHAHFRINHIDYRYYEMKGGKRRFVRSESKAFKYWELKRCLNDNSCPIDKDTQNNLRFLAGLRNEIEHQMTLNLDDWLSGRYQACILNFNQYMKTLFGQQYGLDEHLTYSLQFSKLSDNQVETLSAMNNLPGKVKSYIETFDNSLTEEEYNSPKFSMRLVFTKKMVNRKGQADKVIEFIDPSSDLAKEINKEYWVRKEVERFKHLPGDIVQMMNKDGFSRFNMHHHTLLWKEKDAKAPGKGFGVPVAKTWYWYDSWLDEVKKHCQDNKQRYT